MVYTATKIGPIYPHFYPLNIPHLTCPRVSHNLRRRKRAILEAMIRALDMFYHDSYTFPTKTSQRKTVWIPNASPQVQKKMKEISGYILRH